MHSVCSGRKGLVEVLAMLHEVEYTEINEVWLSFLSIEDTAPYQLVTFDHRIRGLNGPFDGSEIDEYVSAEVYNGFTREEVLAMDKRYSNWKPLGEPQKIYPL